MIFTSNNTTTSVTSTYQVNFESLLDTIFAVYYIYNNMHFKIKTLRTLSKLVENNKVAA